MPNEPQTGNTDHAPSRVARQRGVLLLKYWAVAYAALAAVYAVHCFTGARYVRLSTVAAEQRVWDRIVGRLGGHELNVGRGDTLSAAVAESLRTEGVRIRHGAFVRRDQRWLPAGRRDAAEDLHVRVFASGLLHRLPWSGLIGLVNFIGVALVLYTALGDVAPAFLARHAAQVEHDLDMARTAVAEAEALRQKREAALSALAAERSELAARAETDAKAEYSELLAQARLTGDRVTETLKRRLEADIASAAVALRIEVGADVVKAARERLAAEADEQLHARMVDAFIRQVEGMELS